MSLPNRRILHVTRLSLSLVVGWLVSALAPVSTVHAQESKGIDASAFELRSGFVDVYWDESAARVWLRIDSADRDVAGPASGQSFLYVSSLATGLGSNPVGLDRGQLGDQRIVHFRRVGDRLLLVQENWKYRATTQAAAERRAIKESFADSVLWSGKIQSSSVGELVDLTSFLLRDAHDCIGTLSRADQGNFSLDLDRSFLAEERIRAFPENVEFEAALTFASSRPGALARRTAADGSSITLRQHHSFVQLPDNGYRPRRWDPRVGCFSVSYADYGVPIQDPVEQRLITRHRLEKANPDAELSEPKEPIVYYLDPGVPEPVKEALLTGAGWWDDAFRAAGFVNAFQVRVLPEDADPMDVRYNMIQWVHRATRGWSYGQSVVDPRTGEIIKGHVLLGSLRVRQDHLIFEGLDPTGSSSASANANMCGLGFVPDESYLAQLGPEAKSLDVALARIRQLSAHEVGHTLGFAHNFAASTYADRASVMDYPAPRTKIVNGRLDLSDAYAVGIGEWDKFTVKYAYSQFPPGEEDTKLQELINTAITDGMRYITDADARPAGAAHPLGNLWDNGSDPVSALTHEMSVRSLALDTFGSDAIQDGQPLAELEKSLVPIYLHHRYQVDATAKMLGGYDYTYAVKGDGQTPQQPIGTDRQTAALEALLTTIEPRRLAIPDRILAMLPPAVASSASDRERFSSKRGPIFDPGAAIEAAAELTLGNLLQPQRASRLAAQSGLTLEMVIRGIERRLDPGQIPTSAADSVREARRISEEIFINRLIQLAAADGASVDARATAMYELQRLQQKFDGYANRSGTPDTAARSLMSHTIGRFLSRPSPAADLPNPSSLPPGSPIGGFPRSLP